MNFLVQIGLIFLSSILNRALAPKPPKVKPGTLDIPKATQGDPIGVVFGTVLIKDPIVHWSGGQRAIAVRKKGGKK